jgi:hypothetical protein
MFESVVTDELLLTSQDSSKIPLVKCSRGFVTLLAAKVFSLGPLATKKTYRRLSLYFD